MLVVVYDDSCGPATSFPYIRYLATQSTDYHDPLAPSTMYGSLDSSSTRKEKRVKLLKFPAALIFIRINCENLIRVKEKYGRFNFDLDSSILYISNVELSAR